MKVTVVRKEPVLPPVEKVVMEFNLEEVRMLRYFAVAFATAPLATRRFLLLTQDIEVVEFVPDRCFMEEA